MIQTEFDEFDLTKAFVLRDEGIRQVAESNQHFLEVAREIARGLAAFGAEVTTDDVRRECPIQPLHYNAWGAIWRHKDFQATGKYKRSELVQGHGNKQCVWRLRNGS